ncbi:MAG: hypothetical protein Q8M17_06315, partial [Actinomycetota bacterium]|nr:hypothetical protein [Actinomycetota bacterium]
MRRLLAAALAALAVGTMAACGSDAPGPQADSGFVAGDGSIVLLPADQRPQAPDLVGTTLDGGQFRLAMAVPGKEDFADTLRYYARRLEVLGVTVRLGEEATAADLASYDEVVVATG